MALNKRVKGDARTSRALRGRYATNSEAIMAICRYEEIDCNEKDPKSCVPTEIYANKIEAIKIFYCLYGRNAWHSKWVQKYYNNCMHSSFENARSFAEKLRKQGSVFYLKEIPAIKITGHRVKYTSEGYVDQLSGPFSFIATQINSKVPLGDYDPVCERVSNIQLLKFGERLDRIANSFIYNSFYWNKPQPRQNSIIRLMSCGNDDCLPLNGEKLKAWRSYSNGPKYLLGWSEIENNLNQIKVLSISRLANESHNKKMKADD